MERELMILAAALIYFGILAVLAWDVWDQIKGRRGRGHRR